MTASKPVTDQDAVICEIEINAPPERVFQALTNEDQLMTWWGAEPSVELLSFKMNGRPGGKYRYECVPKTGSDMGAVADVMKKNGASSFICHGEVLECVPPRLLIWSWIANWHEHADQPTVVRWDLKPTSKGTLVRVTHSNLRNEPISRKDYGQGWQGVLQLLFNYLAANQKEVVH
jgi:uncharacterized protein YndB with AHSA1/START domain